VVRTKTTMLLVLLAFMFLPPTVEADTKICPLSDASVMPNATCFEGATCAIFEGSQPRCTGWSRFRCAPREYRNYKTCECDACPAGSGLDCDRDNECCSLGDCGAVTATPKPRPFALSLASRLHPHAATHVLVCVVLSFIGGT